MKIYTYYEDVNLNKQNELLELWKSSWARHGYTPIILSRDDAKRSSMYEEYYAFVQRVHEKVSGKPLPENGYWLAAQLEIVAFTTIDSISFTSDYDIINYDFPVPEILNKELHWRNGCCSCFASGDAESWVRYIEFLFEKENDIVQWCKEEKEKTKRTEFGDQDFLVAIHKPAIQNNVVKMSYDEKICEMYFPDQIEKLKLYHISHNNMDQIKSKFNEYKNIHQEDLRIMMAKKIIGENMITDISQILK